MKQVCLSCERTAPDNNLICQEIYCPAEMSPDILSYGEWLGDIEIIKPVVILRSAVLYEATHQQRKVFLKVGHPGPEHKERLKREAEFLRNLQRHKGQTVYLPVLLPPYPKTTLELDAYGKTMFKGHLLYFYLFQFVEGELLRDILLKRSQLWINHAGWLVISLASAIAFLHSEGLYHFGLSPECILARFDEKPPYMPRLLLFDLGVTSQRKHFAASWYPAVALPAYTAPELLDPATRQPRAAHQIQPDYRTDVYGLGLILYELLVGTPAFSSKLKSDAEVYRAVLEQGRIGLNREDLEKKVRQIALQALEPDLTRRQPDARSVARQLIDYFREVDDERKSRWPSQKTILVFVSALLAIAFLCALAVSLSSVMQRSGL